MSQGIYSTEHIVGLTDVMAKYTDVILIVFGILTSLYVIIAAFRAGILKSFQLGSFKLQASEKDTQEARALIHTVTMSSGDKVPFETEQLASYYAQILAQSKVSFWFSLVFASIGFLVMLIAAFMHSDAQAGSTIARFIAGGIVDAVAALFFVQSKRAQESMADFFEKLRRDRNHVEARKLCESLETESAKDALRLRLSLHYAEVETPDSILESIMTTCLSGDAKAKST